MLRPIRISDHLMASITLAVDSNETRKISIKPIRKGLKTTEVRLAICFLINLW